MTFITNLELHTITDCFEHLYSIVRVHLLLITLHGFLKCNVIICAEFVPFKINIESAFTHE